MLKIQNVILHKQRGHSKYTERTFEFVGRIVSSLYSMPYITHGQLDLKLKLWLRNIFFNVNVLNIFIASKHLSVNQYYLS